MAVKFAMHDEVLEENPRNSELRDGVEGDGGGEVAFIVSRRPAAASDDVAHPCRDERPASYSR